jgi:formylglycine-generating enzyme required for sulfatase activity
MGISDTEASEGRGHQDPYIGEDPYYSDVPWFEDAMPQHTLYLDAFWIAETPVSNAEYKRFLDAHPFHPVPIDWDKTRRTFPAGKDNHPVVDVSWQDANDYAHWVGGLLPTEAEWEKAASWDDENKKKRRYPWGNVFNSNRCNAAESHKNGTTPVDEYSYGASPYGVLDMAGNVWEWTSTVWGKDWHKPDFNAIHILRGGSWLNNQYGVRCVCRSWNAYPDDRYNYIGFRVAEFVT